MQGMSPKGVLGDEEWHGRYVPLKKAYQENPDWILWDWEPLADTLGHLGYNIRWLAEHHGLTLRQIRERSGISERSFYDVISGRTSPTLTTVACLASVFDLGPVDLLVPNEELRRRLRLRRSRRSRA